MVEETPFGKAVIEQNSSSRPVTGRVAFRGTLVTSAWTLCSRILGFVRDALMTAFYGVTPLTGAFFLAWLIPNLFRKLFGEGAVGAAMQPALARAELEGGQRYAHQVFARFQGFVLMLLLALIFLAEVVLFLWLKQVDPEQQTDLHQTLTLATIVFPYLLPICMCALAAAPQSLHGYFALPALSPALLNVAWISLLLGTSLLPGFPNRTSMHWLAAGILFAGFLQWGSQAPGVKAVGFPMLPAFHPGDGSVRRTMKNFAPALLGLAAVQIQLAVDSLLVRILVDSSANTYTFLANRLLQLPLSLVGIAAATGTLPLFARLSAENRLSELRHALKRTAALSFLVILSATGGLFVLATPVIEVLFEHGRFHADDTAILAATLRAYLIGLPAASLSALLTRARQSRQDFRGPAWIAVSLIPVNLGLDLLLLPWIGVAGAGFATSTSLCLQCLWLVRGMGKVELAGCLPEWRQILRLACPAAAASASAWILARLLGPNDGTLWGLALSIAIGIAAATVTTAKVLPQDFAQLKSLITRKNK